LTRYVTHLQGIPAPAPRIRVKACRRFQTGSFDVAFDA
jgi:hypothetical protein